MTARRATNASSRDAGFTLIEVMIALILSMIGLLGTLAVQQTMMRASQNANDASIAMRLAQQTLEEFNVRSVVQLGPIAQVPPGNWSADSYLDSNGRVSPTNPPATVVEKATFRWNRQTKVVDPGGTLPYQISVQVGYNLDSGTAKTVRLDAERYR